MSYLKILAFFSLLGSGAWFYTDHDFEPALAVLGSISALIGLFVVDKKKNQTMQKQIISNKSIGIQAGGDINIGNLDRKNDV